MEAVIALDAGTTSVRSLAITDSGKIIAISQRDFPQYFPEPGLIEHDAEEIWEAAAFTLSEVSKQLSNKGITIATIGIANQRETVVAWNATTSQALYRAIVWQDRRTAQRCRELTNEGSQKEIRNKTGLLIDPYFSATKFEWLFKKGIISVTPELRLGTIDTWLLWKLTEGTEHATEPSNASRTMLFDLHSGNWCPELCKQFSIPLDSLPKILPTSGNFGTTTKNGPLQACIPINGIAGDQQASLFGHACFSPGQAKNTYGTGSFVLINVGDKPPEASEELLTTVAWKLSNSTPTTYAMEGSIFSTGSTVQWLEEELKVISQSSELGPLAESVPDSGGLVIVPALTGLGCPWWDPQARGSIFGINRGTTRAHLARATIEAMAFQTRDVFHAIERSGVQSITELRVGGGISAIDLLLQIQADQLRIPVSRSATKETTGLGAAFFAGLGKGIWNSTEELRKLWQDEITVLPSSSATEADLLYLRWLDAVQRSQKWIKE